MIGDVSATMSLDLSDLFRLVTPGANGRQTSAATGTQRDASAGRWVDISRATDVATGLFPSPSLYPGGTLYPGPPTDDWRSAAAPGSPVTAATGRIS